MNNTTFIKTGSPLFYCRETLQKVSLTSHRHLLVICGLQDWCVELVNLLSELLANYKTIAATGNAEICLPLVKDIKNKSGIDAILGREFQYAVYDAHSGFNPDLFGALSGTVSGGGALILLAPDIDIWPDFDDPENAKLSHWPHTQTEVSNHYLKRLVSTIVNNESISIISQKKGIRAGTVTDNRQPDQQKSGHEQNKLSHAECRTEDQAHAVNAILHTATGHRKRPSVLISNRGRGKSTALGIAAAKLLHQQLDRIIITAPSITCIESCFTFAESLLPDFDRQKSALTSSSKKFEYIPPDELLQNKPKCDMLIVDEAAAIPLPMLECFVNSYSRVAFSSTIHGYEGTGRGFELKFYALLDQKNPGWTQVQLHEPIRWADNDPVEAFIFDALLLNAELAPEVELGLDQLKVEKIDQRSLSSDAHQLSQLFALLVFAHYQTHPRDLHFILDAFDLDIYVAVCDNNIIGTAIVQLEGPLSEDLAKQVAANEKRVIGHILPQLIESQVGMAGAATCRYARIIRIAVHPSYQRQGIGTRLLSCILDNSKLRNIDIVGANFGATPELAAFWRKNGFNPVHLGIKRNASSGTHSLTVVAGISTTGEHTVHQVKSFFNEEFPLKLPTIYEDVDHRLVLQLFISNNESLQNLLSKRDWSNIQHFACDNRQLESALLSLQLFYRQCFQFNSIASLLSGIEACLIVRKVFQYQEWPIICSSTEIKGKKEGISIIRTATNKLLRYEMVSKLVRQHGN